MQEVWRVQNAREKRGEWLPPDQQTYGKSVNGVMSSILGIRQTIPSCVLDAGDQIKKLIKKLDKDTPKV